MFPAQRILGTFKFIQCLWNGLNTSFGGDPSKTIKSVRCFEYEDGKQSIFINYSDGYSKRIENVQIFFRQIIEEEIHDGIKFDVFGQSEYYIIYNNELYTFFYDPNP